MAERIKQEMLTRFNLGGHDVFTSASTGIALSTMCYDNAEEILRDADTAMYRAKAQGKGSYEVFDKLMHARAISLLQLETDLRRAVAREEFEIFYQPIVMLETGKLPVSRRWSGGITRSAGWCRRSNSSRLQKRPI